ncbi:LacI family DNA-binding transcriptional regulator [Poseidonocella sedimentorum]|uniref:Transcriptional regulator, LacI family n=1 Tax=Poseidonocella sedimentorum TaxID=871652 RepID=A0A1I6CRQ9_9RHOB|nr:LacI family DNA-binding transcriptional regulator [Poseidonocella sedimentorum]SFQ95934.1 transcriptional regulator, LacI family [Poseidonocella sedimentorum]
MKHRVTLKDIARHTGVHVSTVSRALDPAKSTTISDGMRKQITDAASALGYRPNRLAAGLRTNRSMTVGVMIPDITNALFPPIVRGIESVLEPLGYASILVNTDSEPEREARLVEVLRDRGVDGIIHAAALRQDPTIARAAEAGMPVVTLNRRIEGAEIPFVINDEDAGIRLAVAHLHGLGHRRIAHVAGPQNLSTGQLRAEAFRRAIRALDLPADPRLISEAQRFDEDEGARAAEHLLDTAPPFTAMVCANDRLALGALSVLRARGVPCPAEVSVTGFNNMPFLDRIEPALTTISIRQAEAGAIAARRLIALIGGEAPGGMLETVLPVELVVRGSTGPCPTLESPRDL